MKKPKIKDKGHQIHVLTMLVGLILVLIEYNVVAHQNDPMVDPGPHAKLADVEMSGVTWTEGFWKKRFDLAGEVMIPHLYQYFDGKSHKIGLSGLGKNHTLNNFRIAAGLKDGEWSGSRWGDGDFYKWVEGIANVYAITKEDALDSLMDGVIDLIGSAQESDGYLNTQIMLPGLPRFANVQNHETYNMGHLILAACAHYKATGKTEFLEIGKKAGNCLYNAFIDPSVHFIGYSSLLGVVDLYQVTGEEKYLDLAVEFINKHGNGEKKTDLVQDRTPIREETQALGHAVWGTYLYKGVTEVYGETGEQALFDAMERIWDDLHEKKFYITGGVSAAHHTITPNGDKVHEAFGNAYQLPNASASNESCSHIGDAMWNYEMLKITGDSKYADVIETILYNSMLAGVGLEGKSFFYTNPLERYGADGPFTEDDTMTRWLFRTGFCCPPNILRMFTSINHWAYNVSKEGIFINLYGSNKLKTKLTDGTEIKINQESGYPWDGAVHVELSLRKPKEFSLMLRIPAWATGAEVLINGKKYTDQITSGQYLKIQKRWKSGDILNLKFPMDGQIIRDNPLVKENEGKVAIKRGPVVYCLESPDFMNGLDIKDIVIPSDIDFESKYNPHLLGGIAVLEGKALTIDKGGALRNNDVLTDIRLIPYYAWANRGISSMRVWLPEYLNKGND